MNIISFIIHIIAPLFDKLQRNFAERFNNDKISISIPIITYPKTGYMVWILKNNEH